MSGYFEYPHDPISYSEGEEGEEDEEAETPIWEAFPHGRGALHPGEPGTL